MSVFARVRDSFVGASIRSRVLVAAVACALGIPFGAGCGGTPTSLLLTLVNDGTAPAPDAVRLRVFDGVGLVHEFTAFMAPAPGASGRLGTVVVFPGPRGDLRLRVQAQGQKQNALVSEGAVAVVLTKGQQKAADLVLRAGQLDGDGDGVPDAIDNCPTAANPGQEDVNGDGAGEACAGGADAAAPDDGGDGPDDDGGEDGPEDDGGSGDAGDEVDGGAGALGMPCRAGAECASGFCVDDVCCESACTDVCRSCKRAGMAGRCAAVAAGQPDPRGGCRKEAATTCGYDGTCNGAGACRRHQAGTVCKAASCAGAALRVLPSTCDGNGLCVPGQQQACAPFACAGGTCKTTCTTAQDCAPGQTCTAGSCGKKALGTACAAGGECNSGHCVDGVCCDVADCSGACRACNVAGAAGSCQNFPANADPRPPGCAVQATSTCGMTGKCDGVGKCQLYPAGTPCSETSCMGSTETAVGACTGTGTCQAGQTRSCGTYLCNGDVCGTSCTDGGGCTAAAYCGGGTCRTKKANGQTCAAAPECSSGFCTDGRCCAVMACNTGQYCGTGGSCVNKRANGQSCANGLECVSGFCTDGVCCESECMESCRRCNAPANGGKCVNVTRGWDTNATPPCSGTKTCNSQGVCQ